MQGIRVFRSRFFWKLVITFSALFFTISTFVGVAVYNQSKALIFDELNTTLQEVLTPLVGPSRDYLIDRSSFSIEKIFADMRKNSLIRATLITDDGTVLLDSAVEDPSAMDNHKDRPELVDARAGLVGRSKRYSETLGRDLIYMARRIEQDGKAMGYLRVALPAANEQSKLREISSRIIGATALGFFFAFVFGSILASRVTIPITEMREVCSALRKGKYDRKVKMIPRDEIGILATTLNRLGDELTHNMSQMREDTLRVKQLERVRQDFVANVSHEIKTPLTTIVGYAETLLDGAVDDKETCKRFVTKIDASSKRLMALVQDIISLSQLESDEVNPNLQPVSWQPLVEQILPQFEDLALKHHLNIVTDYRTDAKTMVLGDKEAMVQIIYNLVSNAIRYTPQGGDIQIVVDKTDGYGILQVIDSGIGISKKDLGRVFERFYRVDKARSRELGGTGLGLAIVKHLTSKMKGTIKVESELGVGSSFTVSIPYTLRWGGANLHDDSV